MQAGERGSGWCQTLDTRIWDKGSGLRRHLGSCRRSSQEGLDPLLSIVTLLHFIARIWDSGSTLEKPKESDSLVTTKLGFPYLYLY